VLTAAGTVSFAVLALPAGVWVDRLPRRPVLVGADLARGVALLSVPVAAALDRLSLAQLAVVALAVGIGLADARGVLDRCRVQAIGRSWECAEDAMAARRRWSELSERRRRLLIAAAVVEGALKLAALIDLSRRPAGQVRGPKWLWAAVVAVVGSAGVVPISYFVFGRRAPRPQPMDRGTAR
jgi:MFS family permease